MTDYEAAGADEEFDSAEFHRVMLRDSEARMKAAKLAVKRMENVAEFHRKALQRLEGKP